MRRSFRFFPIATVLRGLCLVPALWLLPCVAHGDGMWVHPDERFTPLQEALAEDDYVEAQKVLNELKTKHRKANDPALQAEIAFRLKEVTKTSRDYTKVLQILNGKRPDDVDSKTAAEVGKYYCIVKGDWAKGLPLLMKSTDELLAAAATEERSNPDHPDRQVALAEKWLEAAQKSKDPEERAVWQLRARRWMLEAGRATPDENVVTSIRMKLKQLPLYPDRIVVWNTHNEYTGARGSEEILVSLLNEGKVVWQQKMPIAWKPNDPSWVMARMARVRADQIRVDVTKRHGQSGGLGEIQVFAGNFNLAELTAPVVDSYFETNKRFGPHTLIDGDGSGQSGFWIAETAREGWASIHFQQFPTETK